MMIDFFLTFICMLFCILTVLSSRPLNALFFLFLMGISKALIILKLNSPELFFIKVFLMMNITLFLFITTIIVAQKASIPTHIGEEKGYLYGGLICVLLLAGFFMILLEDNYEYVLPSSRTGEASLIRSIGELKKEVKEHSSMIFILFVSILSATLATSFVLQKVADDKAEGRE